MSRTRNAGSGDPLAAVTKAVNFGAFGLLVIFCLWATEKLYRVHQESDEFRRLETERMVQQDILLQYQSDAEALAGPMAEHERRMVTAAEITDVQDKLVAIAKQTHCNLKKSASKGSQRRPLGDKGLADSQSDARRSVEESPFLLNQESLTVSVEGPLNNLLTFLSEIKSQRWLCSADEVAFTRRADDGERLALEMDIVFHDVRPNAAYLAYLADERPPGP